MQYYIKFVDGKSYWSDSDHSESDKIPYYKIDESLNLEVGHPFELVRGLPIPLGGVSLEKYNENKNKSLLLERCKNDLLREFNKRICTLPAKVNVALFGEDEIKMINEKEWSELQVNCLFYLINFPSIPSAQKWLMERKVAFERNFKNINYKLSELTIEELNAYDVGKDTFWEYPEY